MSKDSIARLGVLMGGFTPERHVSLESGRNVYNHLTASGRYEVLPLFLSGCMEQPRIFLLPIDLVLKDNADDVHDFLLHPERYKASKALLASIRDEARSLTQAYAQGALLEPQELTYADLKARIDFLFIALHGRPGEDGTIQSTLERYDIPYNGSGVETTARTIDKYATNQFLAQRGFHVAKQWIAAKACWEQNRSAWVASIEAQFSYPLIAKPTDDGCSAGVAKINQRADLLAYAAARFQEPPSQGSNLQAAESNVPPGNHFLVEAFLGASDENSRFIETTTGLLTHVGAENEVLYEVFEPSEVLAAAEVLSLEEKFLAGEGHNITPARLHADPALASAMRKQVRNELARAAEALNVQGYARIDAFVEIDADQRVRVWILEVNALPALTPATCIFHQCALNGYTPLAFIEAIVVYGAGKHHFKSAAAPKTLRSVPTHLTPCIRR